MEQKTEIRSLYDGFFGGCRAGLFGLYTEFPMNRTYNAGSTLCSGHQARALCQTILVAFCDCSIPS